MAPKGIHYLLAFVSDMPRSKKFYGETLGWKLGTEEGNVAGFSFGTGYLVLHADNRSPADRRYGGGMQVAVQVDDVAAEHARLRRLGVEVGEVFDRPWGERHFSFADADGYEWFYSQTITTPR
jgi:catechol 2,3-dioxygenase-like lactoylglutathione lyase family enzyme